MGFALAASWIGGVLVNACGSSSRAAPDAGVSDAGDDADYDASFDGGIALIYDGSDIEDVYDEPRNPAGDGEPYDAMPTDAGHPDAADAARSADAADGGSDAHHTVDAAPKG
jgi:hypothetical protein